MSRKINYWNEMSMSDFKEIEDPIIFLPVGISEGHGRHLPAGTDTFQADYTVKRVCKELDKDTIIAPTLNYGRCRATSHLSGTLSVSFDSVKNIVYDIIESVCEHGFTKVVIISGHSGSSHMKALELACEKILQDYDIEILLLSDYYYAYDLKGEEVPETDGHGGQIETSRMMDIRGELVKEDKPKRIIDYPEYKVIKDYSDYLSDGMRGDATASSAEEGKKINEYVVKNIVELVEKNF
ncbi:MAG: creatininase family protein [Thermoplasmatota archaeon]